METKHTPGPWIVIRHGYAFENQEFFTVEDHTPDGIKSRIARVQGRDAHKANAALIAAAPDMLETLKEIVSLRRFTDPDIAELAQEAISKAEGKE